MPLRRSAPVRFGSIAARPPLALPRQRIGLLGGSFNPAHEGHRAISVIAMQRLGLDRVWWLVSPGNPLKTPSHVDDLGARVEAARAAADHARIEVTGFEAGLPSPYTVATLAFLTARHPGTHFVWLMGADNLAQLHRWADWRGILATMPVAIVERPGWRLKALASKAAVAFRDAQVDEARARQLPLMRPPAWCYLTGPAPDISSTSIRARAAGSGIPPATRKSKGKHGSAAPGSPARRPAKASRRQREPRRTGKPGRGR